MSTHKRLLLITALLVLLHEAKSQGVGIGVETPNPNAVLELVSPDNNQGLLVPKLTTAQRTATSFTDNLTSNENGLLVYDLDEDAFYFWINSQWMSMQTAVNVSAGTGIQIVDGEISNTGDLDATNELQDISLSGSQLSLSDGSTVDLSTIDTDTQLSESEVDAFVSNNGFLTAEDDPSVPTNLKDGVDWNEIASVPADLADGDQDTQLTEAEVDAFVSNNGFLTDEVDGSLTNEIQDLELDGNTLRITNNASATDIDLAPFAGVNTDEQNLSFDGSSINITNGSGIDVSTWDTDGSDDFSGNYADLIGIPTNLDTDSSDDFDGEFSSLNNVPAGLADGDDVDDADANPTNEIQDLELDGNTLRITNNVSATDIDLAPFMGSNTDEQTLSLSGSNLTISGGNTIDVSSIDTDTQLTDGDIAALGYIKTDSDNQTIDVLQLSGTELQISLEGDGEVTQTLELGALQDGFEANTDNQDLSLSGTTLSLTGDATTVDLSGLQDGTGTDDQNASEVDVTPAGDLTSTDVQAALQELQGEIVAAASAAIPDGAVTEAKIAAGAVTNVKIADVAFSKLTGVPSGLADGDDVGITSETDPTVPANLKDGVDYSEISGTPTIPSNTSDLTNDAGFIDTEADPTVLASVKDGIVWSEVGSIPADIADGDDVGLTSESDPTVPANLKDGVDYSEISGTPTIPSNTSDLTNDAGFIDTESDPTVLASVKDGIVWSEVGSIPADIADGDDVGLTAESDPTVPANLKDGVDYSEISGTPTIPSNTSDLTNDAGFIDTESDPTVLASVKDGIVWSEVGSIPADIADGDADNQNLSFLSDPATILISGGTGLDVSSWDLNSSDDFFLPATESFNTGANILDLTNNGGGITAVFDRNNSVTPNPALRAFNAANGSVAEFDHGGVGDGDVIVSFRTEGNQVASVNDLGQFVGDGSQLTNLPNATWSTISGIPADFADDTDDVDDADSDPDNESLTAAAMSGNTLRITESGNTTNVDLSQFAELPSQSGNSGQFLTTDGTSPSWTEVPGSQWSTSGFDINYSTGNVGIGTTTPANLLSLKAAIAPSDNANEGVFMDIHNDVGSSGHLAGIRFKVNAVDANERFNSAIFHRLNASNQQELNFAVQTNSAENVGANDIRMTIDQNGNVGIGKTPTTRLDVQGDTELSGELAVGGDVGIGTTDPSAKLDVVGNAEVNGDLVFGNDANTIVFKDPDASNSPMIEMFDGSISSFSKPERMVLAYSSTITTWGLEYQDDGDKFNFLGSGTDVMTVDLAQREVGIGTNDPSAELDVVGNVEINGNFITPSNSNSSTSTTLSTPTRRVVRITTNSVRTIGRIDPGVDGQEVILINANEFDITFRNRVTGAGEIATDNILMDGGNNVTLLAAGGTIHFLYDGTLERWLQLSISNNRQPVVIF